MLTVGSVVKFRGFRDGSRHAPPKDREGVIVCLTNGKYEVIVDWGVPSYFDVCEDTFYVDELEEVG